MKLILSILLPLTLIFSVSAALSEDARDARREREIRRLYCNMLAATYTASFAGSSTALMLMIYLTRERGA